MKFLSEEQSRRLITHEIAFDAVKDAFVAAALDQNSTVFPAVIAHAALPTNTFSIKSGTTSTISGLKVGSYWPENSARNEPNHNSTIILMNQENGRIASIIEAGQVNAYRTAAADAVAASVLARPLSSKIAVFGAGHQALFECLALAKILPIEHISVIARDPAKGHSLVEKLGEHHLNATLASNAENACKEADVVVTATPSRAPLFESDWITPGTHVSCMGADCKGKQEAPPALLSEALLFCDLPEQSRRIGEFQHADSLKEIRAIGDVLAGETPGRTSHDDITVFDSSGISLQDLFIAQRLIDAAETQQ